MDHIERIAALNLKYVQGTISPEEMAELEAWNDQSPENRERFVQRINDLNILTNLALFQEAEDHKAEAMAGMDLAGMEFSAAEPRTRIVQISTKWWRVSAAVVFIVLVSVICYRLLNDRAPVSNKIAIERPVQPNDLLPGKDRATLTLSSGQVIDLESAANAQVAMQGAVRITKNAGGLLAYKVTAAGAVPAEIAYNTLTTPKAGQFQVDLPDGTHVWLNNASSLRYPTVFTGSSREVELQGEAFFQVVHDARKPFHVKVGGLGIQDIGTSFNIMAYADEQAILTTLVDGSVKVSGKQTALTLSSSGQQARAEGEAIVVREHANIGQVTAWKNGNFQFENADIRAVLRQISRWYDAEVVYEGKQTSHSFSGVIPRDYNASDVLKILELSDVHFKIEGKKIIVTE